MKMKNARLRLGSLEFKRDSFAIRTRVSALVDRFMGEGGQGHLLSIFGGDAEMAAFSAAISERQSFTLRFPDGQSHEINMGEAAISFRSTINIPGRKRPLRHVVALSQLLQTNGSAGTVFLLNYRPDLAWAILASSLGIPALPSWGDWVIERLEKEKRIFELDGLGCAPCRISVTTNDVLGWLSKGIKKKQLHFPKENGPVLWPRFTMADALRFDGQDGLVVGCGRETEDDQSTPDFDAEEDPAGDNHYEEAAA
jgi:hypothetical protein